ncbi:MAG: TrbC/VirB2 family protein [Anaerolineae bacterium]|nr:TrbC/VirB2 family protein [Anaerolineae bacterium]
MKSQRQQFINNLRVLDPATIRLMTVLIMLGLLLVLPAGTALAQGGDEITTAFSGVVETIVGIIQGLAVVVGIAGLSVWGLARIARPIFPELSNLTQQYIGSLVIGVVVVFVAATVVEGLASAVGG